MPPIRSTEEKPTTSLRRILGAVVAVCVLGWLMFTQTNFITGRALLLAFPGWDVSYRSCWPNPFGGVWVGDVTLIPIEGDDTETYHFDSLSIDVPIVQFYRAIFSRKLMSSLNAIKEIRLDFSGGKGTMSVPFTSELVLFGNTSAAPFEAEGCERDGMWVSDEMADMGLQAEPTELSIGFIRSDGKLVMEQSIHTPGVGRVDYRGELEMHDDFSLFTLIDTGLSEPVADEWHVRDEGFVAARNQHCAKKDGVSVEEYVQRNIMTLERLLETVGVAPKDSLRSYYRSYLEHGTPLDLSITYDDEIPDAMYGNENLGEWLSVIHGGFERDGTSIGLGLTPVLVRELRDDENAESTFGLVQAEKERRAARMAKAAAELAAEEGGTAASSPVANKAQNPAVPTLTTATATAETVASAQSELSLSSEDLAAVDKFFAEADAKAKDAAPAVDGDVINDYRVFGAAAGQAFLLYTKGNAPMRVEVVGLAEGVVRVRRNLRGGWMEQDIKRADFERAKRLR